MTIDFNIRFTVGSITLFSYDKAKLNEAADLIKVYNSHVKLFRSDNLSRNIF